MITKPRFPWIPAALFALAGFCIYPLLSFAAENCIMVWPVVLAIVHTILFVAVFAWCADRLHRYHEAVTLWQFHHRRLNPSAFHIHHS